MSEIESKSDINNDLEQTKIFIGGLSFEATEDDIRSHFSTFGELSHVNLPKHKYLPGKSRGFAFIVYKDPSISSFVVQQKHFICNRMADVKISVPKKTSPPSSIQGDFSHYNTDSAPSSGNISSASSVSDGAADYCSCKLFVGGLASTVNDQVLESYFAGFGPVVSCVVMMDRETNRSRGFGFVVYQDEQSTCKVLLQKIHCIHDKLIEVKPAVPKDLIQKSTTVQDISLHWQMQSPPPPPHGMMYYPEPYHHGNQMYHMVIPIYPPHPQNYPYPYPSSSNPVNY